MLDNDIRLGHNKQVMVKKIPLYLFLVCLFLFPTSYALAATTPEQVMRSQELQEKEKALREKIETPRKVPEVKEELPPAPAATESQEKILVRKINVTGVTFIPEKDIRDIIASFENKELLLKDMQKVADLITDAYRQKGYITSRAYLPPQKIDQGILELRVVQGVTGDIQVRGNRYFKSALLKKKIALKTGEPFNYNTLRRGLSKINEQPDRYAQTVLTSGKAPGTTDVVLDVKDNLPIHLGFDYDNFASRYIGKNRYSVRFMDNNLLGFDDKLTFQYQLGEASRYFLKNIRYVFPVTNSLDLGGYASFSRVKLGKELEDSDNRGKTQIYGLYAGKNLLSTDNASLVLNLGFDYKNSINYQNQAVISHDKLRVVKTGFDFDASDNWGRTIFSYELDCGIPNIMGGLKVHDYNSSRDGAGGKFVKNTINFLRMQKMPFSSNLLWKNQFQMSPYILPSVEQYQLGGISNVRGYPPAEAIGDNGYTTTAEWMFPFYPLPRDIKVPLSKAKLYDAFRLAMFYDWGNTYLRRPVGTERKTRTLRSVGCGLRFNLPENFSLRVDIGWPLDTTPSDENHAHTWIQASKTF